MLFNSFAFIVFLPVAVSVYFLLPRRIRWAWLLIASYYFYACWKIEYLILIVASTLVDFAAGIALAATERPFARKALLGLSLAVNLGMLFAFKYLDFFNESIRAAFTAFDFSYGVPSFDLVLPIGISFYTFQTIGYTLDVYRRKRPPERHLGIFAVYVSFFPQLVAGPIERSGHLLPQFTRNHSWDVARVRSGLTLILWGYFKKLVIADRVARYVDPVFQHPSSHPSTALLLASILFMYQLYCDFSAYCDIAIGTARIMGFELTTNFKRPFASRTMSEFWQRWHISLTRWMFDYVYAPMIARTSKRWKRPLVSFTVFVIIGLWHGAAWNFVLFGAFMGISHVFADATRRQRRRITDFLFPEGRALLKTIHGAMQTSVVLSCLLLACILFRSQSLADVFSIVGRIALGVQLSLDAIDVATFPRYELAVAAIAIFLLEVLQWVNVRTPLNETLGRQRIWVRWPLYHALVFGILVFGEFNLAPFIYFAF